MPVGDAAGFAVADMVLGQKIVFVRIEMRPVRGRRFPRAPLRGSSN